MSQGRVAWKIWGRWGKEGLRVLFKWEHSSWTSQGEGTYSGSIWLLLAPEGECSSLQREGAPKGECFCLLRESSPVY